MKFIKLLAAAALAAAFAGTQAQAEVLFTGSAAGCFGLACAPGATDNDAHLFYRGSTFSDTTIGNQLSFGSAASNPNVNNFGSFTLSNGSEDYNGDVFTLAITFSAPSGTSPNPGTYTANITGNVHGGSGSVSIDFNNTPQVFSFAGGSFTLKVNDVDINLTNNPSVPVSGLIIASAVPEASTWAMMILGFASVGFMAYRRKSQGSAFRIA